MGTINDYRRPGWRWENCGCTIHLKTSQQCLFPEITAQLLKIIVWIPQALWWAVSWKNNFLSVSSRRGKCTSAHGTAEEDTVNVDIQRWASDTRAHVQDIKISKRPQEISLKLLTGFYQFNFLVLRGPSCSIQFKSRKTSMWSISSQTLESIWISCITG